MTSTEFKSSLRNSSPPESIKGLLLALWHDAKGDWHSAHKIAQDFETHDGSWVHAYLHRKEEDDSNARYWYSRARKKFPKVSLETEWDEIATYLLENS
ncbi:MAG TPA: hypothetical protein DGG95_13785 [Cytophagales bacterium]|jgi:hypothetical protein|nr:hypothetical protein [Cytophagales bacterium]